MTPDLTARIEAAARETAKQILHASHITILRGKNVTDSDVVRSVISTVAKSLTTLAEQIISEKDAEAAAMRELLIEHQWEDDLDETAVPTGSLYCRHCEGGSIKGKTPNHHGKCKMQSALDGTAGRETLAELASLRERVRELEGEISELDRGINTLTGIVARNCDQMDATKEDAPYIERAINHHNRVTITPEGE